MIGHMIIQPLMIIGVFHFYKHQRNLYEIENFYKYDKIDDLDITDIPYLLNNVKLIKFKITFKFSTFFFSIVFKI